MTAVIIGTLEPVEWARPAAIGVRATIVPTLVPMARDMKQAAINNPAIIILSGIRLKVRLTVASIHPASLAELAKAPARTNMQSIIIIFFSPAPIQNVFNSVFDRPSSESHYGINTGQHECHRYRHHVEITCYY